MIRVGIAGLGFMGKMHFKCYEALPDVKVVAICDASRSPSTETVGNIPGAEQPLDLTGVELFSDFDKMLANANLDAVSITLPTFMHTDCTIKALNAGVNVLCEKPMALELAQCEEMIAAAKKSGKLLQVGHCIRFWPQYAKTKQLVDSGEYGKVLSATFRRLSLTPVWSWNNWLLNGEKSGGALADMHIHDSDFVQYLFGMPKAVRTYGIKGPSGTFDHAVTNYIYDDQKVITAEGGWLMTPPFGFEMSFNIVLEKATIVYDCTREPAFKLCPKNGDAFSPEVDSGDGYFQEIKHFVATLTGEKPPVVTTPQQSLNSVKIILAEQQSAETSREVTLQ